MVRISKQSQHALSREGCAILIGMVEHHEWGGMEQEFDTMATAKIFEGTWEELTAHADEFRRYPKLTLIVPEPSVQATSRYRADLTPEERIRMLDALAERNRHIPALPEEAFDRESLYADEEELGSR
jgi:hypothetical protein